MKPDWAYSPSYLEGGFSEVVPGIHREFIGVCFHDVVAVERLGGGGGSSYTWARN